MTERLSPLAMLEAICAEIYERWDKDMRSGKLLQALAGTLSRYRADVTAVRQALAAAQWSDDLSMAPTEAYDFFLVRPKGPHPSRGGLCHPTIVQRIDGKFYTSDNELEPIYFGEDEPDDSPLKTTLEWRRFPADWVSA